MVLRVAERTPPHRDAHRACAPCERTTGRRRRPPRHRAARYPRPPEAAWSSSTSSRRPVELGATTRSPYLLHGLLPHRREGHMNCGTRDGRTLSRRRRLDPRASSSSRRSTTRSPSSAAAPEHNSTPKSCPSSAGPRRPGQTAHRHQGGVTSGTRGLLAGMAEASVSRSVADTLGVRPKRAWRQRCALARCFTNAGVVCLVRASPHRRPRLCRRPAFVSLTARSTSRASAATSGQGSTCQRRSTMGRMSGKKGRPGGALFSCGGRLLQRRGPVRCRRRRRGPRGARGG
jgi:hypothetical protein